VGKVIAAYPTASQVELITDQSFAAGVISQKNRVHGILRGQGYALVRVDRVQNEEKVESGEWFYTSGDDRVFPKGMPAGRVRVARPGSPFQEITLEPSGMQNGVEEVLVVLEGVHQLIPDAAAGGPVSLLPPPPPEAGSPAAPAPPSGPAGTEADKIREHYKQVGEAQGHKFGEGSPGSKPPDFNLKPATPPAPLPPAAAQQ
jgi:rod shape-determining protein MreC